MLSLTPDTEAVVGLFGRCYERRPNGIDAPTWQLAALPNPGAMSEQDAWTMEALGWIRDVRNRLEQDLMHAATTPPSAAVEEMVDG